MMRPPNPVFAITLTGRRSFVFGLAIISILSASAQDAPDVEIQLPPGVVLPPGVTLPSRPPRSTAGTNKTAEAKSPEEKRLQELLKLKFNRSASTILDTLADQFDSKKAASTNEVERFKQHVVVGNWPEVGKFLRSLDGDVTLLTGPLLSTNDHGKQVYRYLLKELPNANKASGPPGSPDSPQLISR